jgi:shikimate dehydrogenase/3-dehydroquinate dehydratase type I
MDDRTEPTVVCSILERDAETTARRLHEAPPECGLVEIRGDLLQRDELAGLVRRSGREVVVTVRPVQAGGQYQGAEDERREMLLGALAAGARFVDVELDGPLKDLADGDLADRVILSHHGAACRVEELLPVLGAMADARAARLKIVPVARSPREAGAVRDLLATARRDGRRLACFATGRAGAVTRLMALAWGSWGTYGSAVHGAETAEGQFPARDMLEVYDVTGIRSSTRCFALIGESVFGSPSPAMHGAGYREAGLDARYLPIEIDALDECLPLLGQDGALGVEALAVTMPFKQSACARCRARDDVARASGAVNTVLIGPDGWSGFNTDGPAVLSLVRSRLEPEGVVAAIIGAGGTARAAAAVLADAGARVSLFNRTVANAHEVARSLGVEGRGLDELPATNWDVLVQATPLGAAGEQVLAADRLNGKLVLDAVYGSETPLVRDARRCGVTAIDGYDLLVAQALLQFERMTGVRSREDVLRRAGRAWLASRAT